MKLLRVIRKQKGISQVVLAVNSGIDTNRISLIENFRYIPRQDEKERLAKALGVPTGIIQWPELVGRRAL